MARNKSKQIQPETSNNIKNHSSHMVKVDGIVKKRRCRDAIFLIIFLAYWVVMAYIAFFAIKNGNPYRLLWPKDSNGNYCGSDNNAPGTWADNSNLKNLYYMDPTIPYTTVMICVDSCPSAAAVTLQSNSICQNGFNASTLSASEWTSQTDANNCTKYTYPTKTVLFRCLPSGNIPSNVTDSATGNTVIIGTGNSSTSSISLDGFVSRNNELAYQAIQDLMRSWQILAVALGAAMVVSFIWIFLLRYLAGTFVCVSIILTNAGLLGTAAWLYYYWQTKLNEYNTSGGTTSSGMLTLISSTSSAKWEVNTAMGLFISVAIIASLILLLSIFLARRIQLAIELIKDTTKAVVAMPLLLTFPFAIWVFMSGLCLYFLYISLYILTIPTPSQMIGINITLSTTAYTTYLEYFHLFGFLWAAFVLLGISDVTIAGAIANFYWTLDKSKRLHRPILAAVYRTLVFHLGSICFGSLLIAIIDLIRIFIWQLQRQARTSTNSVVRYILGCIQCCLGFLSKIVKLINKNAYIQMAITGKSFCKSASSALELLVSNSLKVLAVNLVTSYILFISKLAIAGIVGLASYYYIQRTPSLTLNYQFIPVAFVVFEAYFVASVFLNVYNIGIDTIFICFLDDIHLNDGSPERPYHMSSALQRVAHTKNIPVMTQIRETSEEQY